MYLAPSWRLAWSYAQSHMDEEELEVYMTDLRNQVENLKMLLASVETELAAKHENKMVAQSAEVWLMTLRKNLARVEEDTEEAFGTRRELVKLLVEKITLSRNEAGRPKVEITYHFGPPEASLGEDGADGRLNSVRLGKAHPGRQTRSSREGGCAYEAGASSCWEECGSFEAHRRTW